MKRIKAKFILILALAGVLLLGTTACSPEAKELAMAWLEDWLEANDTSLLAVGARWGLGVSTGNEEVDAALDAGRAIRDIKAADEYAEMALKERHEKYLGKAIEIRPNDWSYRISRAYLILDVYENPTPEQIDTVEKDFKVAEGLVGPERSERIRYAEQGIRQMEALKARVGRVYDGKSDLWTEPDLCRITFTQLAHYYDVMADQPGSYGYREIAAKYRADVGHCPKERQ